MKRSLFFAGAMLALSVVATVPAYAITAEDAVGTWNDPKGAVTEIYACGDGICVKILKPSPEFATDKHNPDPAKKNRPMENVVIVDGAKKDGDLSWKGDLYNSENGKTYTGFIVVEDKKTVRLKGCVLGGLICESRKWERIQ